MPDREKSQSIFNLAGKRLKFVESIDSKIFPTNKAEGYYEITKELLSAIILLKGFKAVGDGAHKDLIEFSAKQNMLNSEETFLLDDLRIKRNKSSYEGKEIEYSYLENKRASIELIIKKLTKLLETELKSN